MKICILCCGYGFSARSGGKEPIYQDHVVHMTHTTGQDDSYERTVALPLSNLVGLRFHLMAKAGRHLWRGSSPAPSSGPQLQRLLRATPSLAFSTSTDRDATVIQDNLLH